MRLTTVLERQGDDTPVAYVGAEKDIHNGAIDYLPAPIAKADISAPGMYRTRIYTDIEAHIRWGLGFYDDDSTSVVGPWVFVA